MFLTTCAVCAKALDDDIEAPRRCEPCVRHAVLQRRMRARGPRPRLRRDRPRGRRRGRLRFSDERGRRRGGHSLFTNYAKALYKNPAAVPDDLLEAIATYEKCLTAARRVYGPGHPFPKRWQEGLEFARAALAAPKSARFERALKRVRKD